MPMSDNSSSAPHGKERAKQPLSPDPASWEPTAHLVPSEWGHVWAWQKALEEQDQKKQEEGA